MVNGVVRTAVGAAVFVVVAGGCAKQKSPEALKPQAFYESQHRVTTLPPPKNEAASSSSASVAAYGASANGMPNGAASAAPQAASAPVPASTSPVLSSGSYMLVGTVLGEVNGQPIYADKVLAKLETALHAKATQTDPKLGPEEYRRSVIPLIGKQVQEEIEDELFFAAAQRSITEEDKAMAVGLTTIFRAKEVTRAGGSEAVARSNSLKEGVEFEDRIQEHYRKRVIEIYLVRKIWPRVQVTADDRREFYNRNLETLFTDKAEVKFRVIRVGVREMGDANRALEKATELHARAAGGEEFGKLALLNQDRALAQDRGYMFTQKDEQQKVIKDARGESLGAFVPRGTLANEDLEKAIFALNPGELSEVMRHGEFFYLVKLEERKAGRVRAFEEPDLQETIRARLANEQQKALHYKERLRLLNTSVVSGVAQPANETEYLKQLQPLVEMAMQKYHAWNRPQASASAR